MSGLPVPTAEAVWSWLGEVADPEIPVLSIVDLGIVRDVRHEPVDAAAEGSGGEWVVTLTPTYSGCPATEVIARAVRDALAARGVAPVRLQTQLSPPWTTDWLSADGRRKLRDYGIAPPGGPAAEARVEIGAIGRGPRPPPPAVLPPGLSCPRCGSTSVELVSAAGSTPCKSLCRCRACREPFDHFRRH